MSNQEILEKAIQKAIDGGYKDFTTYSKAKDLWKVFKRDYWVEDDGVYSRDNNCRECYRPDYPALELIFNHDFAKALWGEDRIGAIVEPFGKDPYMLPDKAGWRYHLQQMVIADDPIKYLGEVIDLLKDDPDTKDKAT